MASVAKKIFSKLGAKPQHAEFLAPEPQPQKTLTKIAEDSATSYPYDPSSFNDVSHFDEDQVGDWSHQYPQELPNTSVCRELPGDWTAASHELPDTYISEMQGTECPIELAVGSEDWTDNFYASSLEEWDVPPAPVKSKNTSPKLARIDTSFTHLNSHVTPQNHAEISPQKYTPHSWETALSDAIISPLTASGGADYNTFEISPTDTVASGNSFFTDSGYSTATTMSAWSTTATRFGDPDSLQCPGGKKQSRPFGTISNDWMNDIAPSRPQELSLMPVLASVPQMPKDLPIALSSGSRITGVEKPALSSAHWNDGRSLVQYFSEVLEDHIQHTKSSLKQLPPSSMVTELSALSRTSMASIGLEALASALQGRRPTSVVQIFSLTHIAYAFSIAVDHDGTNVQDQQWFQDSLSWAEALTPERQRHAYHEIARSIWQPLDIFAEDVPYDALQTSTAENMLLAACKHFLDGKFTDRLSGSEANNLIVFESFSVPEGARSSPYGSGFDFVQEMFQSRCKTRVVDELINKPSLRAFAGDVTAIGKRLGEGKITSTRQLELELICVGKVRKEPEITMLYLTDLRQLAFQPASALATFLGHVTNLCDSLYRDEAGTLKSRTEHHIQDVSLVKQHLPEEHFFEEHEEEDCDHDEQHNHTHDDIGDLLDLDFDDTRSEDIQAVIDAFKNDADQTLGRTDINFNIQTLSSQPGEQAPFVQTFNSTHVQTTSFHQQLTPQVSNSPPQPSLSASSPDSANKYRCHCGYTPSGEERWKASNLRRHKRTQHPTEQRVHKCGYPGCKSVFTRSDNLRSHRRDKGHFVGYDEESFAGEGMGGMGSMRESDSMRSSKRRKGAD